MRLEKKYGNQLSYGEMKRSRKTYFAATLRRALLRFFLRKFPRDVNRDVVFCAPK